MGEEQAAAQPDSALTEGAPTTNEVPPGADLSFRDHVKWRQTGELPAAATTEQPAAEEETPAKTEPQSGADDTQQQEEEEERADQSHSQKRRTRKLERLAEENEALKQRLALLEQKVEPAKAEPKSEGEPALEQFDTLEAYNKALAKWNFEQWLAQEQRRQAEEKIQTEWSSKKQAARKLHPDFDEVVDSVAAPNGPGVADARLAMLEDEAGAEILYHLATHPDELKRIAAMSPIAAVREIGRLSAILNPPMAANGKQKLSAAPKPPPPTTRPAKTTSDSIFDPAVQSDFKRYTKARALMKE